MIECLHGHDAAQILRSIFFSESYLKSFETRPDRFVIRVLARTQAVSLFGVSFRDFSVLEVSFENPSSVLLSFETSAFPMTLTDEEIDDLDLGGFNNASISTFGATPKAIQGKPSLFEADLHYGSIRIVFDGLKVGIIKIV